MLPGFCFSTTKTVNGKLTVITNIRVNPNDLSYLTTVSSLLSDLKAEIFANESYKNQIAEKILVTGQGPMLSALNELFIAGYCKFLGLGIELNSSKQKGAPDINLKDLPFAIDAKLYPNNRLYLEDIVNSSAKEILAAVNKVQNQGLLISVFKPDKKLIKKSLKLLAKEFEDPKKGRYVDTTLHATICDNNYPGAQLQINVQPQNVNVYFQANWDMADSITEFKESIETAVKQAKTLSKQAIPWVMVPRDANRHAIEINVLRYFGKFHEFVFQHKDIFMMPVYGLDFEDNKTMYAFDVFQTGQNTLKVKFETFEEYVKDITRRKDFFV
jgi:hypothetical protein